MCQYSSVDGLVSDGHLVHLGSRAMGGAGLIMTEATAVSPEGRITPDDAGLWNDAHTEAFARITRFISQVQAIPGIQLSHAGRKASTFTPWKGNGELKVENGGWQTLAPSAIRFMENYPLPKEMTTTDIRTVVEQFRHATKRSVEAGFKVIEFHATHGYLVHQFLSPLSNKRTDTYGGSFENRIRLLLEIVDAARTIVPDSFPLLVRISATDWAQGGWDLEQSIELARKLQDAGVDLVDASSGGNVLAPIPVGPGYQVPFAQAIRRETGILTGTVGFIVSPEQAEQIIATGQTDIVFLARELLRNPYWPLVAARQLHVDVEWPKQYTRAKI